MIEQHRNWAGNHAYLATKIHQPTTVAEVQELVASRPKIRAVGARHSFSAVADTPGELISFDRLDRVVSIDPERRTATVEAGIRYAPLTRELHRAGFALHNLASLPTISVAGAVSTATHGSGDRNGNLATSVAAIDLITADGQIVTLSREHDGERFRGAVVGIGALGVVARLTLDLVPAFDIRQDVYEGLSVERLEADFDAIMGGAHSVSLFTNWRQRAFQVWVKRGEADGAAGEAAPDYFGAKRSSSQRHLINDTPAEYWTEQGGIPGPWYDRLTHFRAEFFPASGAELQTEYFVPRQHARAALREIDALRDRIAPLLAAAEVRSIAGDDLWLSTCYGEDRIAYHFTWLQDVPGVTALLPLLEERLAPFGARPHWGKLFAMPPAHLQSLYPRLPDFRALMQELDPAGKFRNAFVDEYIAEAR
jgi:xylitol oxidase